MWPEYLLLAPAYTDRVKSRCRKYEGKGVYSVPKDAIEVEEGGSSWIIGQGTVANNDSMLEDPRGVSGWIRKGA